MPLDTVKTRMQSIESKHLYRNSFNCASRIFKEEGFLTFWSGAVPRLARLILSGGIVFTMYDARTPMGLLLLTRDRYEKTIEFLDVLDPQKKYI